MELKKAIETKYDVGQRVQTKFGEMLIVAPYQASIDSRYDEWWLVQYPDGTTQPEPARWLEMFETGNPAPPEDEE